MRVWLWKEFTQFPLRRVECCMGTYRLLQTSAMTPADIKVVTYTQAIVSIQDSLFVLTD